MIRATLIALLALFPAAAPAAGLDAWLARLARAEAAFEADCAALREREPPPGAVWLRLGPAGVEIAPADAASAEAAAFWAEAALGARAAALALYGQAEGEGLALRPVMIETGAAGVSVHDGAALSRGDACDALRRMTPALGGAAPSGNPFGAAREKAASGLAAPVGGFAEARLESAPPEGATARGPDGVTAEIGTDEKGAPLLAVSVSGDARPGETEVRIYAPGDPFRPAATLPLRILPAAAPAPAATGGALAPGGTAEGVLPLGGEARLSIEVTEPGRFAFASAPGADLTGRIETADGRPLSADDDSGSGYGFRFSAELQPGRYYLSLRHCCGGGGHFSVISSPE